MYDIHHHPTWFKAFIDSFHIEQDDLLDVSCGENHLRLFMNSKGHGSFLKTHTLSALGSGVNDFFLLGTDPVEPERTAAAYAERLSEYKSKWDQLELTDIPSTDPFVLPFIKEMKLRGFEVATSDNRSFYHIDLTGSWDDHYHNYIHKKTADLRTRMNKLKRDGYTYTVETVTTGINAYLDRILQQYQERRNLTGQPNAFSDQRQNNMLRAIVPEYEKQGWLKLSILKGSDGGDWAYQLDFVKDGIQYHYAPAFNMQYAMYSPSKILLLETIRNGFADTTLKEFNFMRGESPYKKQFAWAKTGYISLQITNPHSARNYNNKLYTKLSYIKVAFRKLFR